MLKRFSYSRAFCRSLKIITWRRTYNSHNAGANEHRNKIRFISQIGLVGIFSLLQSKKYEEYAFCEDTHEIIFRRDEVAKHNNKSNRIWVIVQDGNKIITFFRE